MDVDEIKRSVIDSFNSMTVDNLRDLNNTNYEKLVLYAHEKATAFKFPLLYLFDGYLDPKIGMSSDELNYLSEKLKFNQIFSLDGKIYNFGFNEHATILYKFSYNNRNYICYSNSGLGISNQVTKKSVTLNRLFFIEDETLWDCLGHYIYDIISAITNITLQAQSEGKHIEIWNTNLRDKINGFISIEEYNILVNFIIGNPEDIRQILCYALLNFACMKYKVSMHECSINHLFNGNDDDIYKSTICKILEIDPVPGMLEIQIIINNCYNGFNFKIFQDLLTIPESSNLIMDEFDRFINSINDTLTKLRNIDTIRYKLDNSLILENDKRLGLFNNIQKSGSCTFYSYYNLAINMKILNAFKTRNVDEVICSILEFHYKMIYIFCLSNDITYIPISHMKFNISSLYNYNYIHLLLINGKILDEIIDFYPSRVNLLFGNNKLIIDKLLDLRISPYFHLRQKKNVCRLLTGNNIFDELHTYIDQTIFNIRNGVDVDPESIYLNLNNIYDRIIAEIQPGNLYDMMNKFGTFPYDGIKYTELYFRTMAEIYIVYLVFLRECYIDGDKKGGMPIDYSEKDIIYLKFIIPSKILPPKDKSEWNQYDSRSAKQKSNEHYIKIYDYRFFLNFTTNELINISKKLTIDFNIRFRDTYGKPLNMAFFMDRSSISNESLQENSIYLDYQSSNSIGIKIYKYFGDDKKNYEPKIDYLLNLYIKTSIKIKNSCINEEIRKSYENTLQNIDYNLEKFLKENYDKVNLTPFQHAVIIYIFSYKKIILINSEFSTEVILALSDLISSSTLIYEINFNKIKDDVFKYLLNNPFDLDFFLKLLEVNNENLGWIRELGFEPDALDFMYNGIRYFSCINFYSYQNFSNRLELVLYRFGININDIDEYLFLFKSDHLIHNTDDLYMNSNLTTNFYILILKKRKCIEINFIDGRVDINNCYIFDSPVEKYKLIFNLAKTTHPFIDFFPKNAPYLCYQKDNSYYLEYIISDKILKNSVNKKSQKFHESDNYNIPFDILKIKIGPSNLFPTISSFYDSNYEYFFSFYYSSRNILKSQDALKIKHNFDLSIMNPILDRFCELLEPTIDGLNPQEFQKYRNTLDLIPIEKREEVFNSFYSENRIVRFSCIQDCIDRIKALLPELHAKIDWLLLVNNQNLSEFIFQNMRNFFLIMEVNILINLITKLKVTTNSGDIQYLMTTIYSIRNFNIQVNSNFYYGFELLFLLQNEYFFKESQMKKYDQIRQTLNLESADAPPNPRLVLHQFMMAKGKTSVITPLVAFCIKLLKDKQPTIITLEHLIESTREYTIFMEKLMNININIFSDYQAKKRWINSTDLQLITENESDDIGNEMNIIDEFDSHYNYLQSNFNTIKKTINISEKLFNYIFDFTKKKIDGEEIPLYIIEDDEKMIKNSAKLLANLNKFYEQAITMKYNEKYGFEFIVKKDYKYVPRLCTPFERKDTPVTDSKFSNILLSLILTFITYQKEKYKLIESLGDNANISNNPVIINELLDLTELPLAQKKEYYFLLFNEDCVDQKLLRTIFEKIYETSSIDVNAAIIKKYLYFVNQSILNVTTEQYNMSFQDIIYNRYQQWQVGYTGTASISLNNYDAADGYVFREKIIDYDEVIEVKLALDGIGNLHHTGVVTLMNEKDSIETNISCILEILGDTARGFVDLAGVFLDYDNREIAEKIKNNLISRGMNKNIVYFDGNDALEYKNDKYFVRYKEANENNFYYFDQCHTVGSDLKQPYNGHVAIIIDRKTRYTNFAQAIFRFRKLNRGTYLSVFLVGENSGDVINNNDVYRLLNENETIYNQNQSNGLKYQLLKAMIRKDSGNYQESFLKHDFMENEDISLEIIKVYLDQNIKAESGLSTYKEGHPYVNSIIDELVSINIDELKQLIFGSGLEIQKDIVKEVEQEVSVKSIDFKKNKLAGDLSGLVTIMGTYYFKHLKCTRCQILNCVPLFKKPGIFINGKNIFISFNLLSINVNQTEWYHNIINDYNRICFVEFDDFILIETEKIAISYYSDKLPIYSCEGKLMVPHMMNTNNPNPGLLLIDPRLIKLFGIKDYLSPKYKEKEIESIVDQLTDYGLVILAWNYSTNDDLNIFNLSPDLLDKFHGLNQETMYSFKSVNVNIDDINHEGIDLENVSYDIYEIKSRELYPKIKLIEKVQMFQEDDEINRIYCLNKILKFITTAKAPELLLKPKYIDPFSKTPYDSAQHDFFNRVKTAFCGSLESNSSAASAKFIPSVSRLEESLIELSILKKRLGMRGGFYNKYKKYKKKYLQLKKLST